MLYLLRKINIGYTCFATIEESLFIKKLNPELNGSETSVKLKNFINSHFQSDSPHGIMCLKYVSLIVLFYLDEFFISP